MAENEKKPLFRQKSLDALNAPGESLNSYLRVTTPGMWIILSSVVLLLVGACIWGTLAHIHTEVPVSIQAGASGTVCYVPESAYKAVLANHVVNLDGSELLVTEQAGDPLVIKSSEENLTYGAGNLELGQVVVPFTVNADLKPGNYQGSIVTEDLTPISLLFDR